jgi:hypothetical protein
MSVAGRRALGRRAAERDVDLEELIAGVVADVLPQLIVDCLSDPTVIRALRATLNPGKANAGPPPLRAAEVKARRRV